MLGKAAELPFEFPKPFEAGGCTASRATVNRGLNSVQSLALSLVAILTGTGLRH